jgi:hypothetical protein
VSQKKRGIHEIYSDDPIAADELVWGRKSDPLTRRGFLTRGGLAAMSAAVGASIPFAHLMPGGLIPAALAQSDQPFVIPGKEGLIVLNDRPINAETPAPANTCSSATTAANPHCRASIPRPGRSRSGVNRPSAPRRSPSTN